jgi:hypothetical protein
MPLEELPVDGMIWRIAVNAEHNERAVLEHGRDVGTTPAPGCRLDERMAFVRVGDDSGGRWNVRDEFLLQVDDDPGVGPDVVDPVPRPVGPRHPRDEQQTILVVQEDLDPPLPARTAARRRQIDDLTVVEASRMESSTKAPGIHEMTFKCAVEVGQSAVHAAVVSASRTILSGDWASNSTLGMPRDAGKYLAAVRTDSPSGPNSIR